MDVVRRAVPADGLGGLREDRRGGESTRAVSRALDLLLAAAGDAGAARSRQTLSALARATALSPATASRLLGTLVDRGLLRRDSSGCYGAGPALLALAAGVMRGEPLHELAGPHLQALADQTGETANLGVAVDADSALYLRQVAGHRRVRATAWTGRTIPRAQTAMGAALAGDVTAQGWVARRGAVEPEITAVAAPVRAADGEIVAALTILAPSYRTGERRARALGRLVAEHARELSQALGAQPSRPPLAAAATQTIRRRSA